MKQERPLPSLIDAKFRGDCVHVFPINEINKKIIIMLVVVDDEEDKYSPLYHWTCGDLKSQMYSQH